jgi:hypothetical protein
LEDILRFQVLNKYYRLLGNLIARGFNVCFIFVDNERAAIAAQQQQRKKK